MTKLSGSWSKVKYHFIFFIFWEMRDCHQCQKPLKKWVLGIFYAMEDLEEKRKCDNSVEWQQRWQQQKLVFSSCHLIHFLREPYGVAAILSSVLKVRKLLKTGMWKAASGHMSSKACGHSREVRIRLAPMWNSFLTVRRKFASPGLDSFTLTRRWCASAEMVWLHLLLVEFHTQDAG